jgi:hypothetical protein
MISAGTAVTLEPHRCYAALVDGAASQADAGNVLTAWLRSSVGQPLVDNLFLMVPGVRNLTTQGGSVGMVLACNPTDTAKNLPAGWEFGLKEIDLP